MKTSQSDFKDSNTQKAYSHLTTKMLEDLLGRLRVSYRSPLSKSDFIGLLCAQPLKKVIDTLNSDELKTILDGLSLQINGNRAECNQQLFRVLLPK